MAFNSEDKVTYNELATSLQELINSKTSSTDYNATAALVSVMYRNLGKVRVSIVPDDGSVGSPVNDNELLVNKTDHTFEGYSNGWYKCGGVYS